jgi:23S rRNA (cytidine1920-2'-O)/16S rRNA (cytidine1409-2'-O)-methyltransferase
MFDLTINLIVADLSFISLTKLLDHLKQTFFHPFQAIMLIKPQFELTSQLLRKYKGKINNPKLHNLTIAKIKNYALKLNYIVHGVIPSSLTGAKANNQEYLIYLKQN